LKSCHLSIQSWLKLLCRQTKSTNLFRHDLILLRFDSRIEGISGSGSLFERQMRQSEYWSGGNTPRSDWDRCKRGLSVDSSLNRLPEGILLQPRVLAVLPGVIPSTVMGVIKPLRALHWQRQIVSRITLEYWVTRRDVENADVVVFSRNNEPAYAGALQYALELGRSVVYELDDNLFDSPLNAELGRYHRSPERLNQLRHYIESASLVRVYSDELRKKIAEINANVVRVDGPVDWSLVPSQRPRCDSRDKVWIVYATSRIQDELSNIFLADVEKLLAAYAGRVELFLWGPHFSRLARHPAVRFLNCIANYDRFFRKFASYGFDIGLAPLLDDAFHLSKSNNKFREYAACGIAGVYSNVKVYSECVEHGVTGVLVENEKGAWFDALARLVQDTELRRGIQTKAQEYARQHYGMDKFCAIWLEQIRSVLEQRNIATSTPTAQADRTVESTLTEKPRSAARYAGLFLKVAARLVRLTLRFVRSLKTRGARETIDMVQWTVNDLSVLFWNPSGHR
jgi:hypothetical protein